MKAGWLAAAVVLATGCMRHHTGPLPGEPADATFAQIDGARVRYTDEGQGPAVVLIHGFASSLETWQDVRPALQGHRVVTLDLKGFGWTDRPEGDYSPTVQGRLVLSLLDHLGIDRASVVAHSWGSSVALAMALEHPERVDKIALYDAWVFEEQLPTTFLWARTPGVGEAIFATFYNQRFEDKLATAYFDKEQISQERVDEVEAKQRRPGSRAAALAAVRGQRYAEYQERYRDIERPVLILWGREDEIAYLEDGERLASMLPDAQMRVYPRCGHFPMIEAQAASTRDLVRFLNAEAK